MIEPSYIISDISATFVFPSGNTISISKEHNPILFNKAVELLKHPKLDWEYIEQNLDIQYHLEQFISKIGDGDITIKDGHFYVGARKVNPIIASIINKQFHQGIQASNVFNFIKQLINNPSFHTVNSLYEFLCKHQLPITEDGCFLAYKRINSDWSDIYTGTIFNHIGTVVEMERNEVDDDPNNKCSAGLHFCSKDYLDKYWAADVTSKVVVLKINPQDVVSIPIDHSTQKGRTCKYKVISQLETTIVNGRSIITDKLVPTQSEPGNQQSPEKSKLFTATNISVHPYEAEVFESVQKASEKLKIPENLIVVGLNVEGRVVDGYYFTWNAVEPHTEGSITLLNKAKNMKKDVDNKL